MIFSKQASRILTPVGHVGDVTTYMAESCHSSSNRATKSTPEKRESRKIVRSFGFMGRPPVRPRLASPCCDRGAHAARDRRGRFVSLTCVGGEKTGPSPFSST